MVKHEVLAEPGGQPARLWRQARSRWRRAGLLDFFTGSLAITLVSSADVPGYVLPLLVAVGAVLPMLVIGALATAIANVSGDRRARRSLPPRPRAAYLVMTLGWALAGAAAALLAWAAGARSTGPGAGEDWIATGLVWATMISACAVLMMLGRVLTAGGRLNLSD